MTATTTTLAPAVVPIRVERFDGGMTLRLPEPPSANRWWRSITVGGRARVVLSSEARAYKTLVSTALTAFRVHPAPADATIRVTIDWRRSRRAGDLDKRLGVVLDALQGTVYVSDAQVTELHARRHDSKGTAALVVTVHIAAAQATLGFSAGGCSEAALLEEMAAARTKGKA